MKELFENYERISLNNANNLVLIDTCAFIYIMEHHEKIKRLSQLQDMAMTSFNIEELLHIEHRLSHLKHTIRDFLKNKKFPIIDINVSPGNMEAEKKFVSEIDNELLELCPDPSDSVLLAVAVKTKSSILTKDKHHIFTTTLENFISKYGIKIYKEIKDIK